MAKSIMVQGTMSNAGKSLLAAGLCRVFRQDGLKVAPFKAQNMALNSFITREGLEMGRAQVVQAEAAGVEPSVLMNPILLKPTNDMGSQIIVNGEVWGQMSAREYFAVKRQLLPEVMKAYDALSARNDVIVIEGAGSPTPKAAGERFCLRQKTFFCRCTLCTAKKNGKCMGQKVRQTPSAAGFTLPPNQNGSSPSSSPSSENGLFWAGAGAGRELS